MGILSQISVQENWCRYPKAFAPYHEQFNFYEGREAWLESIQSIPQKAVYLYSLHWLHLEVYNGGFWQYFYNSTSNSYPEALEGFSTIGMPEVANIIKNAVGKLGEEFPFEKELRISIVGQPNERMDFSENDNAFYEIADTKQIFRRKPKFVAYADKYAQND